MQPSRKGRGHITSCRPATHTGSLSPAGHSLLLPLTQSLYVNGKIACTDKVLIDIGTGYFVEVGQRGACVTRTSMHGEAKEADMGTSFRWVS